MAHFKPYSYNEVKHLEFCFEDLLRPNTIEYAIHSVVDQIELSVFEARHRNDTGGASAYAPAILLKIILLAYSRGIISSRQIARACRENLNLYGVGRGCTTALYHARTFCIEHEESDQTDLSGGVAEVRKAGAAGHQRLALDGCKLSSNAAKEWSGTCGELEHKRQKLEALIEALLLAHQQTDRAERSYFSAKRSNSKPYKHGPRNWRRGSRATRTRSVPGDCRSRVMSRITTAPR